MVELGYPTPRADDVDDVAWALTTGGVVWGESELRDALVWLRRAVQAAAAAGRTERAQELGRIDEALRHALAGLGAARVESLVPESIAESEAPAPIPPTEPPLAVSALPDDDLASLPVLEPPSSQGPPISLDRGDDLLAPPPAASGVDELDAPLASVAMPELLELGPASSHVPEPTVAGLELREIAALAHSSIGARTQLAALAKIESLADLEEASLAGLVLVLEGEVTVQPTVVDVVAATLARGEVAFGRGTLDESVSLRVVAKTAATVARWSDADVSDALSSCPWVLGELQAASNRLQAMSGAALGPLADRLDDEVRGKTLGALETRVLAPGEVVAVQDKPVPGVFIVGVGTIDLVKEGRVEVKLGPGDFLFASEVLGGAPAPATARAAAGGALVLYAERALAHDLLVSFPTLLEIFASV